MTILYLLIPLTLVVMGIAIWAFLWSVKSGQFDDLEGPAYRILMDDDDPRIPGRNQRLDKDESWRDKND
jgi:cbb3-type cytochrome oxidase maturation protein